MPKEMKPIVLVADDEPSTVAMLSSHLRSKGYTVLEASDGDQAWELAHEHLPNLVLLDVMMPGMSGWEVCRKIREAVSLAHTGVIMLTGIGENLNEMTSPLYGADAYLDKPFEFSDLDQKISETIARRSAGALGRADTEDDPALVKNTLRAVTARKPAKAAPAADPKPKAAVASKKAGAPKIDPTGGPKPALAKAVARPAPKLDKPAKAKAKALPATIQTPAKKSSAAAAPPPKPSKAAKPKATSSMTKPVKAKPPAKASAGPKATKPAKKPTPIAASKSNAAKSSAKKPTPKAKTKVVSKPPAKVKAKAKTKAKAAPAKVTPKAKASSAKAAPKAKPKPAPSPKKAKKAAKKS